MRKSTTAFAGMVVSAMALLVTVMASRPAQAQEAVEPDVLAAIEATTNSEIAAASRNRAAGGTGIMSLVFVKRGGRTLRVFETSTAEGFTDYIRLGETVYISTINRNGDGCKLAVSGLSLKRSYSAQDYTSEVVVKNSRNADGSKKVTVTTFYAYEKTLKPVKTAISLKIRPDNAPASSPPAIDRNIKLQKVVL